MHLDCLLRRGIQVQVVQTVQSLCVVVFWQQVSNLILPPINVLLHEEANLGDGLKLNKGQRGFPVAVSVQALGLCEQSLTITPLQLEEVTLHHIRPCSEPVAPTIFTVTQQCEGPLDDAA